MLHASASPTAPPAASSVSLLDPRPEPIELEDVAAAYTTRHVDLGRAVAVESSGTPRAGDLVLAEVTSVGQHARLESVHSRRVALAPATRVVVAYGPRYAPDQFEAVVPDDLGPCHLVAAGGIAGRVLSRHQRMQAPTALAPIGFLIDEHGKRLSTADGAPAPISLPTTYPHVLLVVGAAMNAGKTTTAATACRGFTAAGLRAGAAKITGTGAGNDRWAFHDHGARPVLDFTDFGYASTWGVPIEELIHILEQSVATLAKADCDVAVIELADGVLQDETAALLQHPALHALIDGVIFAAPDALSAVAGLDWLTRHGHQPLAISGLVSASPLASRECTAVTETEVWGIDRLADPCAAQHLYARLADRRSRAADV